MSYEITRGVAVNILRNLPKPFPMADAWPDERLVKKLEDLPDRLGEGGLKNVKDKKAKDDLKLLFSALEDEEEVVIVAEKKTKSKGGKPPAKVGKALPKKGRQVEEDDDELEDEEDEEDKDEEEEDTEAEDEEEEEAEEDELEEDEEEDEEEAEEAEEDEEEEDLEEEDESEDSEEEEDEDEDEEDEEEMETTTKKKGAKGKAKAGANGKKTPQKKVKSGPGVIDSIVEFLENASKDKPLTRKAIANLLAKRFKGRDAEEFSGTIKQQVPGRLISEKGMNIKKVETEKGDGFYISKAAKKK